MYARNPCSGAIAAAVLLTAMGLPGPTAGQSMPVVLSEVAELTASDPADGDSFGAIVAMSGDVAVMSANSDDPGFNAGAAYVFRFNGTTWIEEQKLTASDAAAGDSFGSVSVRGDVIAVGAGGQDVGCLNCNNGAVYVFRYDGVTWVEEAILVENNPPGGGFGENFGEITAVGEDTVVVGEPDGEPAGPESGLAYVFRFNGIEWLEEAMLTASDAEAEDRFARRIAISEDIVLVGAAWEDEAADTAGAAYVYRYNGNAWVEEEKLTASDAQDSDFFGASVAVSGNVAVIGAVGVDDVAVDAGAAYVFRFNGTTWIEEQKLTVSDGSVQDRFGSWSSVGDNLLVVGAVIADTSGENAGAAYVFQYDGSEWVLQANLLASDGAAGDFFGNSVALNDEDVVMVGAGHHDHAAPNGGAVYVFDLTAPPFIRGDADSDGTVNGLVDGLYVLLFQFAGGTAPPCFDAADADDSGTLNGLVDGLYILNFQFVGGSPPPPPPYPTCGMDPTLDALNCAVGPGCP